MKKMHILALAAISAPLAAMPAYASCTISNNTDYSFTIDSGNTTNQSVSANGTTSIDSGNIVGKSSKGNVGGSCSDGGHVKIIMKDDAPVLVNDD